MVHKMYILIVEDNQADAYLIKEAFIETQLEADFEFISDGMVALEFLRKLKTDSGCKIPDLIILDLNLPKISGKELLFEIKHNHALKTIPVVIFSTSGAENDITQCYQMGSNCYIIKPYEFAQFETIIQMIKKFWFDIARLPETRCSSF